MKKNTIITAAAIVLFIAGMSHLIRIFYDWDVEIISNNSGITWEIPIWASFISTIITLLLAYNLIKIKKKR